MPRQEERPKLTRPLLLCLALLSLSLTPALSDTVDKLQDQVQAMDKDVTVLKEVSNARLDAQEKRIADLGLSTAQHANHLAAISNQGAQVANYVAWTSVGITFIFFAAGLVTYFSAVRRAKEEARQAAEAWLSEAGKRLHAELAELQEQGKTFRAELQGLQQQLTQESEQTIAHAARIREDLSARASLVLASGTDPEGATNAEKAQAVAEVQAADEALRSVPENTFTHEQHFMRGVAYFSKQDFRSALDSFRAARKQLAEATETLPSARYLLAEAGTLKALGRDDEAIAAYGQIDTSFGTDPTPAIRELVALALVNKGNRLLALNRGDEAIAVYEQVDIRFGSDPSATLRKQVAGALNAKGFAYLLLAKQSTAASARRSSLLESAIVTLERGLALDAQGSRVMLLGNLGYARFLAGQTDQARHHTRSCLVEGGAESYEAQLADAQQHRLEPEDSQYETMLKALWAELHDIAKAKLRNGGSAA